MWKYQRFILVCWFDIGNHRTHICPAPHYLCISSRHIKHIIVAFGTLGLFLTFVSVDQDGFAKDAQALTLRTRLGYETPAWRGFKALAEVENVTAIGDAYNSTTNGKLRYPVVADPEVTELNRAQVSWTGRLAGRGGMRNKRGREEQDRSSWRHGRP